MKPKTNNEDKDVEWNKGEEIEINDVFNLTDNSGNANIPGASKVVHQQPVDKLTVFDKKPKSSEASKQKDSIMQLFDPNNKSNKKLMQNFDNSAIIGINENLKEELLNWDSYLNLGFTQNMNTVGFKAEKKSDEKSFVEKNHIDSYLNLVKQKNSLVEKLRQKQVSLCTH